MAGGGSEQPQHEHARGMWRIAIWNKIHVSARTAPRPAFFSAPFPRPPRVLLTPFRPSGAASADQPNYRACHVL